jgi:hypothetical protein
MPDSLARAPMRINGALAGSVANAGKGTAYAAGSAIRATVSKTLATKGVCGRMSWTAQVVNSWLNHRKN